MNIIILENRKENRIAYLVIGESVKGDLVYTNTLNHSNFNGSGETELQERTKVYDAKKDAIKAANNAAKRLEKKGFKITIKKGLLK